MWSVTGLRAVTWRVEKKILLPFLWWICFSPRDTSFSPPYQRVSSYRSWPHTHTHTERGGYKFHWRRKGKDGYFFLAGGLNIQMISSKYHLRGIARRKPSLAPQGSITHRWGKGGEEQGSATVYKWSVSKWQREPRGDVAGEPGKVMWERLTSWWTWRFYYRHQGVAVLWADSSTYTEGRQNYSLHGERLTNYATTK